MKFGMSNYAAVVLAVAFGFACAAQAQTYSVLYKFTGSPNDGNVAIGSLIQSGNVLYGMTNGGGANGNTPPAYGDGTIFSYNLSTKSETVLHNFGSGPSDGRLPFGSLFLAGSTLYGTTAAGGTSSAGTVFSYDTGSQSLVVTPFTGTGGDGGGPGGSLIQVGQSLYGLASIGGATQEGAMFSYNPVSHSEATLYSFGGSPGDGSRPGGSVLQSGSTLYGLTGRGGSAGLNSGGFGTIFAYDTTSGKEASLYSFQGSPSDGADPQGSLIQSGSILYGLTSEGGLYDRGSLFAFDTSTKSDRLLYSFSGKSGDGSGPLGSLIQSGSMLYGTTISGGVGGGTVFSFDTTTDSLAILHAFGAADGSPHGDLLLDGNALYGMAGTDIFSIALPEPGSVTLLALGAAGLLTHRPRRRSL